MFRFAAIVDVSKLKTTCMLGHHTWIHITGSASPANLLDKLKALKRAACNRFQLKTGVHHGGLEVHVHVLAAIEATCMTRYKSTLNTIYGMHTGRSSRQTNNAHARAAKRYTLHANSPN